MYPFEKLKHKSRFFNVLIRFARIVVMSGIVLGILYILTFYRSGIERRYGFITRTPDLLYFPHHVEVMMVSGVDPGGAFGKAGFKDGDIILKPDFHSVNTFHNSLDRPKGTIIEFEIIARDKFEPECDFDAVTGKIEKRKVIAP